MKVRRVSRQKDRNRMSDDIMPTHGAGRRTSTEKREQRYVGNRSICGVSESWLFLRTNFRSHDHNLTIGTTLPAAAITPGWLSTALLVREAVWFGQLVGHAGLRRFRPGVPWRFRTCARTNRKRAPKIVLLQYVGPFLNQLSACTHNLELYIAALEESQATLDALLGTGHWQM